MPNRLTLSVVTYAAINGVIARYAIRPDYRSTLLPVLFRRAGSTGHLIFFATAIYYSVFEGW